MAIDEIIEGILAAEGGYSDIKEDLGGKTNFGITEAVARANGFFGDMKVLPRSFAIQVYKNRYYFEPKFDHVATLSPAIAEELMDSGVNQGTKYGKLYLQQALNLLNRDERDYKDVTEDGSIGPATLAALAAFLNKRGKTGEVVMLRLLNVLQASRYIEITRARAANAEFLFGWLANRVVI